MYMLLAAVIAGRGACCRVEVMAIARAPPMGIVKKLKGNEPAKVLHLRMTMAEETSCRANELRVVVYRGLTCYYMLRGGVIDASRNVAHWLKYASAERGYVGPFSFHFSRMVPRGYLHVIPGFLRGHLAV